MKNAVVCPETARVAIMQSAPNPAGGILNLIGATRGKLCGKSRSVRRRLSQNSFIQPRHIRKYVQWPPHKIDFQEPLWSSARSDPVDRLFSELAGRALRAHRCFHRFRPERTSILQAFSAVPEGTPRLLLATGKFLGEGFDDPRLDTLFLTMPISWKGTLAQYAGRLHRLYDRKTEVIIYDYADLKITMTMRMFERRVAGYRAIGYRITDDNAQYLFPE